MKKITRRLQFTKQIKQDIYMRDHGECLFCREGFFNECTSEMLLDIKDPMHYINKSAGGLGIEQNGVLGCRYHHMLLDNGNKGMRKQMLDRMQQYLKSLYPGWNEDDLKYKKYDF